MRIDHRTGSVHFGTDLSEAQRTDLPEGPHIQSMPSEQVIFFQHLVLFSYFFLLGPHSAHVNDVCVG